MRPHKYIPGEPFSTLGELRAWLESGGWVYWHGRPKHPSIIISLQFRCILSGLRHGIFYRAMPNEVKQ
jgi:hypothetical protein